jgi:hypothetical protein
MRSMCFTKRREKRERKSELLRALEMRYSPEATTRYQRFSPFGLKVIAN